MERICAPQDEVRIRGAVAVLGGEVLAADARDGDRTRERPLLRHARRKMKQEVFLHNQCNIHRLL